MKTNFGPGFHVAPGRAVDTSAYERLDRGLVGALVMGLWNRLSRHQDRNAPFRLTRIETGATRQGLAALAMLQRQELEGFVEGLFGKEEV